MDTGFNRRSGRPQGFPLHRRLALVLVCALILCASPATALAGIPHEDPETAKDIFSGIALLRYYSSALDSILQKDADETEARLGKMPFAHVPPRLERVTGDFATSGIDISHLVVSIDEQLGELREMVAQFRLEEATEMVDVISEEMSRAYHRLEELELAAETTGRELKATSAPPESELRSTYEDVIDRLDRIGEMLDRYSSLLEEAMLAIGGMEARMQLTELTLKVEPVTAYVGDEIHFQGVLTSLGEPLAGRVIDILLNGTQYASAVTGGDGCYYGTLQLPYEYISPMTLQALYYPRDDDVGHYLSSLSPAIELEVLFYPAELTLTAEDKAYPGQETTVGGRFYYRDCPLLDEREIEVYLDDVWATTATVPQVFHQKVKIAPEMELGQHTLTVSVPAVGRYAPLVASVPLEVTRATPAIALDTPRLAMIPGGIELGGRIYSELGPLGSTTVQMSLGKSQVEVMSCEDGSFETQIEMGMAPWLFGSQDLEARVVPPQPWYNPTATTTSIVVVNVVSCGGALTVIICLVVLVRRRLGKRIKISPRLATGVVAPVAEPQPRYSDSILISAAESGKFDNEPRSRIFNLYRRVVRLIQGITRALFPPQQTLREFFREVAPLLGPAAGFFDQLTGLVERLLYSSYQPTEGDADRGEQLSREIERGLKSENL